MGKLSDFMAMKRDLAFEYERELRAVRNAILGITRLSGSEYTIDLAATEGFVASSSARKAFAPAFQSAVHDALLTYAHDLAREGLMHGLEQDAISAALAGVPQASHRLQHDPSASDPAQVVRLAARA